MNYDVIIIGGGPAGLSAGLYAGRARLKAAIIEKSAVGGQIFTTSEIENYPGGLVDGDSGPALIGRMKEQVKKFGVDIITDTISDVELEGTIKKLKGKENEYSAKAVIIATGAVPKLLSVPGESDFAGKGISYCATCDGPFYQDLDIYVIGGGDAAVEEAIQLANFAKKVTIIHRRDELKAAKIIQERAFKNPKIEFIWDSEVVEIKGDKLVSSFVIENKKTGEQTEITPAECDFTFGLFVLVGFNPATTLFEGKLNMEKGYIVTNDNMETSVQGVFAAGDNRVKSLRQVITATADGAIAAVAAERYITSKCEEVNEQ